MYLKLIKQYLNLQLKQVPVQILSLCHGLTQRALALLHPPSCCWQGWCSIWKWSDFTR